MIRRAFGAAVIALAMTAGAARAQLPQSFSIRADNDAFNFWKPPYSRPDEEYTSGVRGSLLFFGTAGWEKWLHPGAAACAHANDPCATHSFSLGQDIYTGKLVPGDTTHEAGVRPNAGWLYLQESSRIERNGRTDESSITIGVTGPPALGEVMQNAFHALAPDLNRPTNWSVQIPFEVGVVAAFDRTQRVLTLGDSDGFGAALEPHGGASIGNILTEARAGLRARVGFDLRHPWRAIPESAGPRLSFFGDVTGHGVLRNEFLMGTMFRSSPHVDERPFVAEYQLGISLRVERLTIHYSLDQTGTEYTTRPNGHAWSRIGFDWKLER